MSSEMDMAYKCKSCAYFISLTEWYYGECRGECHRHAPLMRDMYGKGKFPMVQSSWTCNEFKLEGDDTSTTIKQKGTTK